MSNINFYPRPTDGDVPVGGFIAEEIITPIFDKSYKVRPLELRWRDYKERQRDNPLRGIFNKW